MTAIMQTEDPVSTLHRELNDATAQFTAIIRESALDLIHCYKDCYQEAKQAGVDEALIATLIDHHLAGAVAQLNEVEL